MYVGFLNVLAPFLLEAAYNQSPHNPPTMTKQLLPLGLGALVALGACQQSTGVQLTAEEVANWSEAVTAPAAHAADIRLYEQGERIGDAAIKFDALHHMLALEPDNAALKDSLASLYFASRMFGPAVVLVQDLLAANPTDARYLEMGAVAQNSLGLLEDALTSYERLLAVDANPYYAYQIATLQYGLNRFDQAEASVDNMLAADLGQQQVNINLANGRAQTVPMKAALLNIKGVLRKDVHKDVDRAKEYFELAMAEAPDFQLAANNLRVIEAAPVAN